MHFVRLLSPKHIRTALFKPVVHGLKVSRTDLLGDLKFHEKRMAYLDIVGLCWYVLGEDANGRSIGDPSAVPSEGGVLMAPSDRLDVTRMAPKRPTHKLPFSVWMALGKSGAG